MVFTHGTEETLKDRPLVFNPAFLLDALDSFTGDSLTLHLPADRRQEDHGPDAPHGRPRDGRAGL